LEIGAQKLRVDKRSGEPGATLPRVYFRSSSGEIGLGHSLSLLCVYFQHSMSVDAAESSNVCQPSWYLIASAAGMLQSAGDSWTYWRDSIPYSHSSLPLSCRISQCHLICRPCHTSLIAERHNTGSLTRISTPRLELNLADSMSDSNKLSNSSDIILRQPYYGTSTKLPRFLPN